MHAILALRLLAELHRNFNRQLDVAYIDIKSAFDSVDREYSQEGHLRSLASAILAPYSPYDVIL